MLSLNEMIINCAFLVLSYNERQKKYRIKDARHHSVCSIIFGAIDYLCIEAKLALLVQREDKSYMSRLRDTDK